MSDSEVTKTVNSIREVQRDIETSKGRIKTANELITDKKQEMDEWLEVESLKEQLGEAKKKLALALSNDPDHNNRLESLGQEKDKLTSLKNILSDHIVVYYGMTQERQVEMTEMGDARTLILSGRLGKEEKFQTSLFGQVNKKVKSEE